MTPVTLEIRWQELFGNTPDEIPKETRFDRWEEWKRMATEAGQSEGVEYWSDISACVGCKHLGEHSWCNLGNLPCTVNPYSTFKDSTLGMACMGLGYEPKQLELFEQPTTQL